jgi:hypothetical protein
MIRRAVLTVLILVALVSLASAVSLRVTMFCNVSPTGQPAPVFLGGHAVVNDAGDLMVDLKGVVPNHTWGCFVSCPSTQIPVAPNLPILINFDNTTPCGTADANGHLSVNLPGFLQPLFQASQFPGLCGSFNVQMIDTSFAPPIELGCFNGVGTPE